MNYTKKLNKIIAVLLSATLLSACGWQLRGSLTLPEGVNSIYIADSSNSSNGVIALTIANILKQSNIDLATSSTDARKRGATRWFFAIMFFHDSCMPLCFAVTSEVLLVFNSSFL